MNDIKNKNSKKNIVYTVTANCSDCYRCIRVCPVKAIRITEGQAHIEDELCIKCGTCVKECPQNAKTILSGVKEVKQMLRSEKKVAASIAPSFPAAYDKSVRYKLPSALKAMGFSYISETAEGALFITEKSFEQGGKNIFTACPSVVSYIEKYKPEYLDKLVNVVSPMIAHGKLLKKRLGNDWNVVFIGPCAAKKQEILRPENEGSIDAVLTFEELNQWFEEENIDLNDFEDGSFESYGLLDYARLFPLQGGMLKTGNAELNVSNDDVLHISGPKDIQQLFDLPLNEWQYKYVEPLYCQGGCINGPGITNQRNPFLKNKDIIDYAQQNSNTCPLNINDDIDFKTKFTAEDLGEFKTPVDESKIQEILERTGKGDPEMQLNCGACGYNTCKEKAIAVAKGMAEAEMCMPYMRRLAKQQTDKIIESNPNGIVILDDMLNIINMNRSFQKMFMCGNALLGRRISYLLDASGYEDLLSGSLDQNESIKTKYGIRYHELVYALRDDNQYVGIYTDMSKLKFDDNDLNLIKKQTIAQAKELLSHQINFSQQMAHFLGKSTAQSEELVKRLMDIYTDDGK